MALAATQSDRRNWQRILDSYAELLRRYDSTTQTLIRDRDFLHDLLRSLHCRYSSQTRRLRSRISQMRKVEGMVRGLEERKAKVGVEFGKRIAAVREMEKEYADQDLADSIECIEALRQQILQIKKGNAGSNGAEEQHILGLQKEIKKLKHDLNDRVSRKDSEISALVAEKDFIWNQFNEKDKDLIQIRETNRIELAKAQETIQRLQSNVEELHASDLEKDKAIARLRADITQLELNCSKCSRENHGEESKTTKGRKDELSIPTKDKKDDQSLTTNSKKDDQSMYNLRSRPSRSLNISATPSSSVFKRCSRTKAHASSSTRQSPKSTRQSPRLFSASFKVPKLKDLPPSGS